MLISSLLGGKVLDLKSLTWSKLEAKAARESPESTSVAVAPCAGHSLVNTVVVSVVTMVLQI